MSEAPLKIGVSACLLGRNVRYDGGHKRDDFVTETLARHVELVPVCPEVEVGMGTPRETIRLVDEGGLVRLRSRSGIDHTESMRAWARARAAELEREDLCGYVLKKDSPSCGLFRVKVHPETPGPARRDGRGLFADALVERFPHLPVEEEGRLHDPRLREAFCERVFAYRRLKTAFAARWTRGGVVAFHSAEKLLLMAHHAPGYRELGRLVAAIKDTPRAEFAERYQRGFMEALARPATVGRHVNVLQHAQGYFKRDLGEDERAELSEVIADYRAELVPLIVPVTLIRHHARRFGVTWLLEQTYLAPHPKELMLRNHV